MKLQSLSPGRKKLILIAGGIAMAAAIALLAVKLTRKSGPPACILDGRIQRTVKPGETTADPRHPALPPRPGKSPKPGVPPRPAMPPRRPERPIDNTPRVVRFKLNAKTVTECEAVARKQCQMWQGPNGYHPVSLSITFTEHVGERPTGQWTVDEKCTFTAGTK